MMALRLIHEYATACAPLQLFGGPVKQALGQEASWSRRLNTVLKGTVVGTAREGDRQFMPRTAEFRVRDTWQAREEARTSGSC